MQHLCLVVADSAGLCAQLLLRLLLGSFHRSHALGAGTRELPLHLPAQRAMLALERCHLAANLYAPPPS